MTQKSPDGAIPETGQINKLIHEPARLNIMACLFVIESADFLFLTRQTGLTDGNLSSHMAKLEDVGYIQIKKDFVGKKPRTMLSLTEQGRTEFQLYRANIAKLLGALPDD
jgi:DNA-binding MarR family transcriptional regulator